MFAPLITTDSFLLLDAALHQHALTVHQQRVQQLEQALAAATDYATGSALSEELGRERSLCKVHAARLQELRAARADAALFDAFRLIAA